MPKTAHFEWETPELKEEADVPADLKQLAEEIEGDVHNLAVSELGTAGAGDAKKLLIVQNTGAAAWKAMKGDATLAEDGTITIANAAVITAKLAAEAVTEAILAGESVATAKIKNLAVTAAKIAVEAVEANNIKNGVVGTTKLTDLGVTSAKIAVEAVLTEKLANLAVTAGKLANEAVETGKLKNLAVTAAKLAAEAVTTEKIANLAVTEGKIADGAVSSRKFKPTCGVVRANANLTATGVYTLIPGCKIELTPLVASKLEVTAIADIIVHVDEAGNENSALGGLFIDGAQQTGTLNHAASAAPNLASRASVSQVFSAALTAAKHTIELRGKNEGFGEAVFSANSSFLYELVAS